MSFQASRPMVDEKKDSILNEGACHEEEERSIGFHRAHDGRRTIPLVQSITRDHG